jgi:hypothetical protein
MFNPTISGSMVDPRAHVFISTFCFELFAASTFFINLASTAGPFLTDLDIIYLPRRLTINLSEAFDFLVLYPRAGLPHGVLGPGIPIGLLPSPPPCG